MAADVAGGAGSLPWREQRQAGAAEAGRTADSRAIWPQQAGAGAHFWQPPAKAPNLRTGQVLAARSP